MTSESISESLYLCCIVSILTQVIPVLSFALFKVESIALVLICAVIFAGGEFAFVLHRWYDLDDETL